jgi:lipoprotein NlpD
VASVHVVRAQDTIKGIARRYGVSVGDIIRWNQLTEADRIFPGNRLRVASLGRSGRDGVEEEGEGGFR